MHTTKDLIKYMLASLLILVGIGILIVQPFTKKEYSIQESNNLKKEEIVKQAIKTEEAKEKEFTNNVSNVITQRFEQESKKDYPDIADAIRTRILNGELTNEKSCESYTYNKDFCKLFLANETAVKTNNPSWCLKYNKSDSSKFKCIKTIREKTSNYDLCSQYLQADEFINSCKGTNVEEKIQYKQ